MGLLLESNIIFNNDIWMYLLQQVPALAILLYFGWKSLKNQDTNTEWIKGQLDIEQKKNVSKDKAIQKLNDYIRESEKANLEMLNEMNSVIDQMVNNTRIMNEKVIEELDQKLVVLKKHIIERLDKIENNMKNVS